MKKINSKEIKEEIFNNSMLLSYSISIIIIGIFSFFYKENNSLIIGIALSTLLLVIIQCFIDGNNVLNIVPIIIMILFGFFQEQINNLLGLDVALKDNIKNLIIILALSSTFIVLTIKNISCKTKIKKQTYISNNEKNEIIKSNLSVLEKLGENVDEIQDYIDDNNADKKIKKMIRELRRYIDSEATVNNVKSTLINKGNMEDTKEFSISEIEQTIVQCYGANRYRKINAVVKEKNNLKEYIFI